MTSIPANQIVNVQPSVLSAGGNSLDLTGLILTENTRVPIGTVSQFATQKAVADFFGAGSTEAALATNYFAGFDNSSRKPAALLIAQYPGSAVAPYLQGGPVAETLTLAQLQALSSGTLTISFDGTPHTSSSISLASATSFSNAATLIQAAFTTPPFTVVFDSVSQGFKFLGNTAGASHTVSFVTTDALATALELTSATGAILSQGADAAAPGTFMDGIVATTQNWATFMTIFDPDGGSGNTVKLAFAAWVNSQNSRYGYVVWDTDVTPTQSADAAASFGNIVDADNLSGVFPIWDANNGTVIAAFVCGTAASIDFTQLNGRVTFAFRGQAGLVAGVTSETVANNLLANGYNFYGAYATANAQFVYLQDGQVSGEFVWFDSYVDQIWLNNSIQLALMNLLANAPSLPYNQNGYEMIKASIRDTVDQALNFGAIRVGVTLSASQISAVNAAAGINISDALENQGWYMQVLDPPALTRQQRKSPIINFWYVDGESVQQIDLTSTLIQ